TTGAGGSIASIRYAAPTGSTGENGKGTASSAIVMTARKVPTTAGLPTEVRIRATPSAASTESPKTTSMPNRLGARKNVNPGTAEYVRRYNAAFGPNDSHKANAAMPP